MAISANSLLQKCQINRESIVVPNEVLRQILLRSSSQKFCWVESNDL